MQLSCQSQETLSRAFGPLTLTIFPFLLLWCSLRLGCGAWLVAVTVALNPGAIMSWDHFTHGLGWTACALPRSASPRINRPVLLPHPAPHPFFEYEFWGAEPRSSCFHSECFAYGSLSPALILLKGYLMLEVSGIGWMGTPPLVVPRWKPDHVTLMMISV